MILFHPDEEEDKTTQGFDDSFNLALLFDIKKKKHSTNPSTNLLVEKNFLCRYNLVALLLTISTTTTTTFEVSLILKDE